MATLSVGEIPLTWILNDNFRRQESDGKSPGVIIGVEPEGVCEQGPEDNIWTLEV
jgi:hypothetical protein